jgi:hypothetical protein
MEEQLTLAIAGWVESRQEEEIMEVLNKLPLIPSEGIADKPLYKFESFEIELDVQDRILGIKIYCYQGFHAFFNFNQVGGNYLDHDMKNDPEILDASYSTAVRAMAQILYWKDWRY